MRISRALALAGIASRRKSEEHVRNGAVSVNGEIIRDLGRQVDPQTDAILFRGRPLIFSKYVYFILNKPVGYTTTASDPYAEKTVFELLPAQLISESRQPKPSRIRVFPVGRLDRDSCGLLLFTNDGELANRLTHPRYEVEKFYEVRLNRPFDALDRPKLFEGVKLEDGICKVRSFNMGSRRVARLSLCEGKKREVRRIFEALGYTVLELSRLAMGSLTLKGLRPGRGRFLTFTEIERLKKMTHLA